MTRGFQRGDLVIVAARPSMGKTSLVLNICQHVATNGGVAGFFSLEMSKEQLFMRMLASEAQDRQLPADERPDRAEGIRQHHARARDAVSEAQLYIDDTAGIGVLEMRAKARRLQAEHGLDLLAVDYIQLMTGRGRFENRTLELASISRSLKGLAKELNVPIVVLSQLSRAPEARSDKRPQLSDLRESGALEQDADVVILIFREEMYKQGNEPSETDGIAELILAKQRNGPTGIDQAGVPAAADAVCESRAPGRAIEAASVIRCTSARVDLEALAANFRSHPVLSRQRGVALNRSAGAGTVTAPGIIAVVKANAYGHGAAPGGGGARAGRRDDAGRGRHRGGRRAARRPASASRFSSSARSASATSDGVFDYDLTPTISSPAAGACTRSRGRRTRRHARATTSRSTPASTASASATTTCDGRCRRCSQSPHLRLDAVYTHFATADEPETPLFDDAARRFDEACRDPRRARWRPAPAPRRELAPRSCAIRACGTTSSGPACCCTGWCRRRSTTLALRR